MTIGRRIKQRRLELEMTVDELADRLGKNRATVYRYENDEIKDLPTTVLIPLAEVLQTTPADLMGYDNELHLTEKEHDLIIAFRKAPNEVQQAALRMFGIQPDKKENDKLA